MLNSKRVLYVGSFHFPECDAAGLRVLNNGKLLKATGHEVSFLSFENDGINSVSVNKEFTGFKYGYSSDFRNQNDGILLRIFNFIFMGRKALKYLLKNRSQFDVVILYNPFLFLTVATLLFSIIFKKKIIVDLTEWYDKREFLDGKFRLPYLLSEFNMRLAIKLIRNKILISRFLGDYYQKTNNIILPPLVDLNEPKWVDVQKTGEHSTLKLIYAGSPQNKDNLKIIVESVISALKLEVNVHLTVFGITKSEFFKLFGHEYKDSELINILFCGRVSHEKVIESYKSMNYMILIRENTRKNNAGFPTKLVESIVSGTPVIINSTSNISDFLSHGIDSFIINELSTESIVDTLKNLSNLSENEYNELIQNLQLTRTKFAYDYYKNEFEQFIQNLR